MTKRDAYRQGWSDAHGAGFEAACHADPDISEDGAFDILSQWDEGFRQYSPFEFFAAEINGHGEWRSDDLWDAYRDGQTAGFKAGWKSVRPWPGTLAAERYARKALREASAEA